MRTAQNLWETLLQFIIDEAGYFNQLIVITGIAIFILLAFCGIIFVLTKLNQVYPGVTQALKVVNKILVIISVLCTIYGFVSINNNYHSEKDSILIAYIGLLSTIINIVFAFILYLLSLIPIVYKKQFSAIETKFADLSERIIGKSEQKEGEEKVSLYRFTIEECLTSIASLLEKTSVDDHLVKYWIAPAADDRKRIESILDIGKNTLSRYCLMAHFSESTQRLLAHSMYDLCKETYSKFIERLLSNTPCVPDFFAHSYDDAIVDLKMTEQKCTSLYGLKRFFEFYKDRGFTMSDTATYERIFILSSNDLKKYPTLKFQQIESLYNVLTLLIPNKVQVKFISINQANGIKRKTYPSQRLDFSISKIDENKYLVLSLGRESQLDFYDKKITCYDLYGEEETKDGVTCKYYEELRKESIDSRTFVNKNLDYWETNGTAEEKTQVVSFRDKFKKLYE